MEIRQPAPTSAAGEGDMPMEKSQLRRPLDSEIDVHGVTHPGLVRAVNQDHFLIGSIDPSLRVFQSSLAEPPEPEDAGAVAGERTAFIAVVADGVGSTRRGEEAARFAVAAVTRSIAHALRGVDTAAISDEVASAALEEAARRSHHQLRQLAAEDPQGMATTLTAWVGLWPRAYVLQVGDSRAYLLRNGELTQVSRDQTVAEELVEQGVLSRVQAAGTRWAHVLSSAIGGPSTAPVVTRLLNDWESVHMLCSDGLTKHVSDEQIRERLMTMTSARQVCEALLQDALEGGGTDNITVIVGRALRG
jgi:serine/threonine protein phosphatase PrpC